MLRYIIILLLVPTVLYGGEGRTWLLVDHKQVVIRNTTTESWIDTLSIDEGNIFYRSLYKIDKSAVGKTEWKFKDNVMYINGKRKHTYFTQNYYDHMVHVSVGFTKRIYTVESLDDEGLVLRTTRQYLFDEHNTIVYNLLTFEEVKDDNNGK